MQQSPTKPRRVIFVHGYGSSSKDFSDLPRVFESNGYRVDVLTMPGHCDIANQRMSPMISSIRDFDSYEELIMEKISRYDDEESDLFLIGFSFGATVCLNLPNLKRVKAIIAISPFLGLSRWNNFLISSLPRFTDSFSFPRILSVTRKDVAESLDTSEYFNIRSVKRVCWYSEKVLKHRHSQHTPTLIIHSISDAVSSYEKSVKYANGCRTLIDFVPLDGLNHFIVHDLNNVSLYEFLNCSLYTELQNNESAADVSSQFCEISNEHRFWAKVIFNLILAFFTVFGVHIYQTLPAVLNKEPGSPYYLLSYSTVISIYIMLATMYLFFLARTQVYLSLFVEPFMHGIGFQRYKANGHISGSISTVFTRNSSVPIAILPLSVSILSMVFVIYLHANRIFTISGENFLLNFWFLFNTALLFLAIKSLYELKSYTEIFVYGLPASGKRHRATIEPLKGLYQSVVK